jgi:hypothetical protein
VISRRYGQVFGLFSGYCLEKQSLEVRITNSRRAAFLAYTKANPGFFEVADFRARRRDRLTHELMRGGLENHGPTRTDDEQGR